MILQFLKFVSVGVLNTLIGLAVIVGMMYFLDAGPIAANLGGYLVGGVVSFALNGRFTFRQELLSRGMFFRFVAIYLLAYLANLAALRMSLVFNKYLAQIAGMLVYTVVGFVGCRLFVYRQPAGAGAADQPAVGRPGPG